MSDCVHASLYDKDERARFLRDNSEDYGYGFVDDIDTSKNSSSRIMTTDAAAFSCGESTMNDGSSKGLAVRAATSGRKIDLIRKLDFPHLLQSATAVAVRPAGPAGTPADHNGNNNKFQRQPGSTEGKGELVYLDHAGATLFGTSQLAQAMDSLLAAVQGNPHSQVRISTRRMALRAVLRDRGLSCIATAKYIRALAEKNSVKLC